MISIKEIDQEEVDLCFELDSKTISLWTKKQWECEFKKKGVKVFALLLDNKIIGICEIQLIIDEVHLNYFSILHKFRCKGYGSFLMCFLIQKCEKLNLKKILLEVSEFNSIAENFYKRFSFTTVGRRKNYYKDGSDALLKEKNL